jgi:hypothetical protein
MPVNEAIRPIQGIMATIDVDERSKVIMSGGDTFELGGAYCGREYKDAQDFFSNLIHLAPNCSRLIKTDMPWDQCSEEVKKITELALDPGMTIEIQNSGESKGE